MRIVCLVIGVVMILGAVRFALDASSHLTAATATSGLAIGSGLYFLAAASIRPDNDGRA